MKTFGVILLGSLGLLSGVVMLGLGTALIVQPAWLLG
jgi:hypothetical protein